MKATDIPAYEENFRANGVDSDGKKFTLNPLDVAIPGSADRIAMVECARANGDESFFYQEIFDKKRIALHFTAGYLKGDIATLTKPNYHVSTPFVVARDGTIYNLWTSKYWSYHLGSGAQGGNEAMSRSSVAIEISNIGYLLEKGDDLETIYDDVYCTKNQSSFYQQTAPYRGQRYFATYTEAQYISVVGLLRFLTAKYDIPRDFVDENKRYDVVNTVSSFRGITSHVNYRPSGKWDIGPAFDWNRVINGVTA